MIIRRKTREISLGGVPIGGGSPIAVQSMTNTDTKDVRSTDMSHHGAQTRSRAQHGYSSVIIAGWISPLGLLQTDIVFGIVSCIIQ